MVSNYAKADNHKFGGYFDMYWTNSDHGQTESRTGTNNTIPYRSYDNNNNDFGVNTALNFSGSQKNLDFFFELTYGEMADTTRGDLTQAYITYNVNKAFSVSAGRMDTNVGYESRFAGDNFNYTRSLAYIYGVPTFHEGVAFNYGHDSGFSAGFYVYDGYDETTDSNSDPSMSLQLAYERNNFSFVFNHYTGSEEDSTHGTNGVLSGNSFKKTLNDVTLAYSHQNLDLALNYVAGEQERITSSKDTEWKGYAFYARYKFNARFSLAGRYEIFSDESDTAASVNSFAGGTNGNEINGITLTAGYDLRNNSELRFEYNQLDSDKKDLSDVSSNGTAKADDGRTTYTLAWIARF
jgi:hypothetical protein